MSPRPRVHSIAFELTTRCNLRCAHCYNAERGDREQTKPGHVDRIVQRVERILEVVELHHATLTGGEPLLFPRLFDVIERLEGSGVPCQIISNGLQLDEDLAVRLVEAGVRGIQLSLHGPDAPSHEDYTGVAGSFARTLVGAEAAVQVGLPLTGCIVVTRRNAHLVGETLSLWKSLGVTRIALSRFSPAGLAGRQVARLLPSLPEVISAFDQALAFANDGMQLYCTMPIPSCALETKSYAPIRFGCCAVGTSKQELALGPAGELRNCTLHQHAIGGVRDILAPEVDVAALFGHPDVTEYRKGTPSFCDGCLHAGSCGGGCGAASMSVLAKDRSLPDPFLWQHVDDDFEAQLQRERADEER